MKKLLFAALAGSVLLSAVAVAGPHGHGPGLELLDTVRQLDLSQQQRQDIRQLIGEFRADAKALAPQKPDFERFAQDRLTATEVDAEALSQDMAARLEQHRAMRLKAAQLRNRIYNVLNTEQKNELAESDNSSDRKGHKKARKLLPEAMESLDLSDQQNAQITPLREQLKVLKAEARSHRQAFDQQQKNLIRQTELDADQWLAMVIDQEQVMVDDAVALASKHAEIMSVLTETQRQALAEKLAAMKPDHHHKGNHRDKHRG